MILSNEYILFQHAENYRHADQHGRQSNNNLLLR